MDTITIDLFGFEKKVSENITGYLQSISESTGIPLSQIHVKIAKPEGKLEVSIFYQNNCIEKPAVSKLVEFFIGKANAKAFDLESKIIQRVSTYLKTYSKEKAIELNELSLRISSYNDKVIVAALISNEVFGYIPLKELINYFNR